MAKPKKSIETYAHTGKERVNNPPVGLVTPDTDKDAGKKTYTYDPHLDPQLQWAGKAEHTSFEVPTVSLHVHERIDPRTIVEAVRKRNGSKPQMSLFAAPEENPPIRQAIEFYKHRHNWTNRLIAGDSLLVMNSLLEKEGLGGQVQMVYIDPPYGIRYGSNFQPFVNKRDVTDGKDEDLTQEPETIRAFRDTWELGIHSYLAYLRDRLLLARELLHESGSCFVQISDENVHHARELMDEVFGPTNFLSLITFRKTTGSTTKTLPRTSDYLLFYGKEANVTKYRKLYLPTELGDEGATEYRRVELPDESLLPISRFIKNGLVELPVGSRVFATDSIVSKGGNDPDVVLDWEGRKFVLSCKPNRHWKPGVEGIKRLWQVGRLLRQSGLRIYKRYFEDFPYREISHVWTDTRGEDEPDYVVQTSTKVLERCILMTTDPGDLVFDPTCGSGTTAHIAEQWGRRWITCDTSRVATALAKQRIMTASYDYYELAYPDEGIGSGFRYKTVPHITLGSIAKNPDIREGMSREAIDVAITRHGPQETLYDQPEIDLSKTRVTGPFTVEAVPAPAVQPLDEIVDEQPADSSVARTGQTLRQADWRDELFRTGIRGKAKQRISFARLEPLSGTRWLHADGETKPDSAGADRIRDGGTASNLERVVVSFGPDNTPMEQRQVALAIEEAQTLVPKPTIIIFAAFQFDSEAAKDIDETNWPGVTLLKAQMNADLLTDDLKKKRASNESFWLIGQPDVELEQVSDGEDKGKFQVSVRGFDYYNTKTGNVESGGRDRIAMWMLDPDYDGRSLFPRQVFFPMAGDEDGWAKLAKNLKAEIDTDLIEAYRGTTSLPFAAGESKRIAVKIIDDRGIESLKILSLEDI